MSDIGSNRELEMCCTAYVTQCTSCDRRYSPRVVDVVLAVHVPLIEPRRLDVEELQRLKGEARGMRRDDARDAATSLHLRNPKPHSHRRECAMCE